MKPLSGAALVAFLVFSGGAGFRLGAEEAAFGRQESASGIRHSFFVTGSHTVFVGEQGEVLFESKGASRDGFVLSDGHFLFTQGKQVREVTPGGEVVWSHELSAGNKELGTAVRLPGGNTLIVERGPRPQLLEVAPDGTLAVTVPLQPETDNGHMQTRMARKLPGGNYLVPHLLAFQVKEYEPDGTVVKVIRTDLEELGGRPQNNWPFTAIRLANGNTLVNLTHGNKVAEFGPDGKVAWRLDNADVDGRLADPCGGQRLPNGNTIICSYGQKDPAKPRIFEVTSDKKVVWEFFHPDLHAHEVHVVTTNGENLGAPLK